MLTAELKKDGRSMGIIEMHRTGCDLNQEVYMAQMFEQKPTGDQRSTKVEGIQHWRPNGEWVLVRKCLEAMSGKITRSIHEDEEPEVSTGY